MQPDANRMPARYYASLCDLLKTDGLDIEAVLRAADIWPTQIYGPDATLSVVQFEALVDQLIKASGRTDLGFLMGRQVKLSSHEILGNAILTSPTLDYALQIASRYYRLMNPAFEMQYRHGPKSSEVIFQPIQSLGTPALRFLLEMVVVSAHEQIKSLIQEAMPVYGIYVSYAEPAYVQHYRKLQPAIFHFGYEDRPGARMVLSNDALSRPLPLADKASLKMAEARCEQLIQATIESRQMTEWVTMILRESTNGFPSLAELAQLLNQSPRTLDRQLSREGSRFLEISKRIRQEKACALLQAGTQSVSQIALQLGYNEVASFSRAFKRESGCSPSEYQQKQGN